MNTISIKTIREDAHRFSKLHSWYKHISWPREQFYIWFRKGERPRYNFDPEVKDPVSLHIWMGMECPENEPASINHFVWLTPLFRGNDGTSDRPHARPVARLDEKTYSDFLAQHGITGERYPPGVPLGDSDLIRQEGLLYERERLRMIDDIVEKAVLIAKEKGIVVTE